MIREKKIRVAVIEDQQSFREALELILAQSNFDVISFPDAEKAFNEPSAQDADVLLVDLRLPGMDGLQAMARQRYMSPDLPVVLMTGHADIPTAVQAIQGGAYDFIEKPFDNDRLCTVLRRAGEQHRLLTENRILRAKLQASTGMDSILCGESPQIQELRATIARLAPTPTDVLITGETGTGKELVARLLHDYSGYTGNYVALNCAAIPEHLFESELFGHEAGAFTGALKQRIGKVEHAKNGTLFLDEVNTMPLSLQAKLLRVLQQREIERLGDNKVISINFRLIATSNADLSTLVNEGKFRPDFYYRLNVVAIEIPPLRDRIEDIPLLFQNFLDRAAMRFGVERVELSLAMRERLMAHSWPGNVRELKYVAERAVLDLPLFGNQKEEQRFDAGRSLHQTMDNIERGLVLASIRRHHGDLEKVCDELQLNLSSLYRKVKKFEIDLEPYRVASK